MAENLLAQPFSQSVSSYDDLFFNNLVTDLRTKKTIYHTYYPTNTLTNATVVTFELPAWTSSSVYHLHEALMSVHIKLVGKNGEKLPDDFECSVTNNVVGSIFEDMKVYFNGTNITAISNNYHYKNIIESILNYDDSVKSSWLQSQGFATDTYGAMDQITGGGNELMVFLTRENYFSKLVKTGTVTKRVWSDKGHFFVGSLANDFSSTATPLINGVSIKFVFTLTPQNFFLLTADANKDVKYVLTHATIHIPVGELSDELALKITHRLQKEACLINYRRRQVLPFTIPANSKMFVSDTLFVETSTPCRVIFAFVKEEAFLGKRSLNGYNFLKSFGTDSNPCDIESSLLTLNGQNLDGLECLEEETLDYLRLFLFNEQRNTGSTNSISLDAFRNGYYFLVFDLTSSLNSSSILANPTIRGGQFRFKVTFTSNTPINIIGLAYAEYPSTIKITQDRRVGTNFLT